MPWADCSPVRESLSCQPGIGIGWLFAEWRSISCLDSVDVATSTRYEHRTHSHTITPGPLVRYQDRREIAI
jgi:hypothetical protein